MKDKIKNLIENKKFKLLFFFLMLWVGCYLLLKSGIFFENFMWDMEGERRVRANPDINDAAMGLGFIMIAIIKNPFRNLFANNYACKGNIMAITGVEEHNWVQAQGLVNKYGSDAITKLALRESDDFLSDHQRMDFYKTRIAAELLLQAKKLNEKI